jgi:prevent-host-death family protein
MMTVTVGDAQTRLSELIHQLSSGEEIIITENEQPVARLLPAPKQADGKPRQLGTMRGSVLYMASDFDAPLDDFKEYME